MSFPLFSLNVAPGTYFPEVAAAAIQVAALPCMPYVEFDFNGRTLRATKYSTVESLWAELTKPR